MKVASGSSTQSRKVPVQTTMTPSSAMVAALARAFSGRRRWKAPGRPLGEDAPHLLHEHKEGGGLDTAAGGSRRSADEHQDDQHKESGVAQGAEVDGGKTRRTGRHAVEEGRQPADVVGQLQQHGAHNQQYRRGGEHHLGVQGVFAEPETGI